MPTVALLAGGGAARPPSCFAITSRTSWRCAAAARWRCSSSRWCPSRRSSSAAAATSPARWCRSRAQVGFSPIVVDDLEEMATRERFPDAARLIDSFDVRDWKDVPLDDHTYVVIVTRDHAQDQALLEQLIGCELAYLGLIGSRRKIEMFKQRLDAQGHSIRRASRGCTRRSGSTSAPRRRRRSRSRSSPS